MAKVLASQTMQWVMTHMEDFSAEDLNRCTKIEDRKTGESFYLVINSRGLTDAHGLIEYAVRYDEEHGFTCGCPSGQHGFWNVKHASGTCQHVRLAIAASVNEKAAKARQSLRDAEEQRIREEEARKAEPIEVRWNVPAWMMKNAVDPKMRRCPRER